MSTTKMSAKAMQEALLALMEQKTHWSNAAFATGGVPRDKLHIHFEQEYGVFVRDFPIFAARAYIQCPVDEVRRDLAANIYEEETGGISAKAPHPALFLEIPRGFGMDMKRFERARLKLLPGAKRYRAVIDKWTSGRGWEVSAAVTTIFIEGTQYERGEVDGKSPKRPMPPIEQHPLHVHYGLPLAALALPKVHRDVEGDHRGAAWRMMTQHVAPAARANVVRAVRECLAGWHAYKDAVARACGLARA
jgi:pyrroloquinoline-quinone synthase